MWVSDAGGESSQALHEKNASGFRQKHLPSICTHVPGPGGDACPLCPVLHATLYSTYSAVLHDLVCASCTSFMLLSTYGSVEGAGASRP